MRQRRQATRGFEHLESRTVMAGNVTAVVVGGNLTITGDAKSNLIDIQELSGGGWFIQGVSTKINGHKGNFTTAPVTGDIDINLGDGKNFLNVHDGVIPGHLSIVGGVNNDTSAVFNLSIGDYLNVVGGDGNDTLLVSKVAVSDPTFAFTSNIDMGAGKDSVNINKFTDQDLDISMGAGNDKLQISNSQLLGGPNQHLTINTGDDRDSVSLSKIQTGALSVDLGAGNKDSINVQKSIADTADFLDTSGTKGSISGNSNDFTSQTIDPNFTHRSGDLTHNI
jgi:hypothetical protein